jgi:hypothetical protein
VPYHAHPLWRSRGATSNTTMDDGVCQPEKSAHTTRKAWASTRWYMHCMCQQLLFFLVF